MKERTESIQAGVMTGVAVAILMLFGGFIAILATGTDKPSDYKIYGDEAIAILEKYKDTKYTASEAAERLQDLYGDILDAKIRADVQTEKDRLEYLESEVNAIKKVLRNGKARDMDIDDTIKKIKKGR